MSQSQPLTILFADVSGSTQLFELRGDVVARQLVSMVLAALSKVCATHNGQVIKTIGDEIMCTFPSAMQGLLAAINMQKRMTLDTGFAHEHLAIRIGLHHGDALLEDGDVYGDAVNTAARMAAMAKREQIVTTATTLKGLTNTPILRTRSLGQARVSGKLLPIDIVDIVWQEDTSNVTMVQRAIRLDESVSPGQIQMVLRYRGQVIELNELSQPITLGRDANNSLVIEAEWVSRNHAIIEYKRGHFVISDRSTNGTYVKLGDDEELRLHRDECHLRRIGTISLGQAVKLNPDHVLYFQCLGNL